MAKVMLKSSGMFCAFLPISNPHAKAADAVGLRPVNAMRNDQAALLRMGRRVSSIHEVSEKLHNSGPHIHIFLSTSPMQEGHTF